MSTKLSPRRRAKLLAQKLSRRLPPPLKTPAVPTLKSLRLLAGLAVSQGGVR